jgi:acyl dehydratase
MSASDFDTVAALVRGQTWEEMVVGQRFRTGSRTVTETDLVNFITCVGITEPLFLDDRHAGESSYTGRLVPGALTYSFAEGLVLQTNALHGTGLAFMHMELDVQAPVYVGNTLTVIVEVTGSRPSGDGSRGVVTTRNTVIDADGRTVLVYTPVRLIRGRSFGLAG